MCIRDRVKSGVLPEAYTHAGQLWNMLLGVHGGCLGETCALLLIAGGLYLLARGVITWHIPLSLIHILAHERQIVNGFFHFFGPEF